VNGERFNADNACKDSLQFQYNHQKTCMLQSSVHNLPFQDQGLW
jgi:hypothetical protein